MGMRMKMGQPSGKLPLAQEMPGNDPMGGIDAMPPAMSGPMMDPGAGGLEPGQDMNPEALMQMLQQLLKGGGGGLA
jgi:hypothetical protein